MRAVGVTEFGGPEALHVLDLPAEPLGPGQVRLRVTAVAVSPTDAGVRSGLRASGATHSDPPTVPGMDAAGTIVEIGPDVDADLAVGELVMAVVVPSESHGAYREDLVVPAASV